MVVVVNEDAGPMPQESNSPLCSFIYCVHVVAIKNDLFANYVYQTVGGGLVEKGNRTRSGGREGSGRNVDRREQQGGKMD